MRVDHGGSGSSSSRRQPQAFQQATLIQYGVFGGIRGHSVVLYNVSQQSLHDLEGLYWIDAIKPFVRNAS